MPQLDFGDHYMLERRCPPPLLSSSSTDVFSSLMSSDKVNSIMRGLCSGSDGLDIDIVKLEEVSPHPTHSILGKALTLSLGTENGYETEGGSGGDDTEKWRRKPPESWTRDDVMDWIYDQAIVNNADLSSLRGENFQQISGERLCQMSETDFIERDGVYGALLYRSLQDYRNHHNYNQGVPAQGWHRKRPVEWNCADVLDWLYYGSGLSDFNLVCLRGETFQGIDGPQLCSMTCADFERRDQEFGVTLFNAFQAFIGGHMKPNEISMPHSACPGKPSKETTSVRSAPSSTMGQNLIFPKNLEQSKWVSGSQCLDFPSPLSQDERTLPDVSLMQKPQQKEKTRKQNNAPSQRQPVKRPRKTKQSTSGTDISDDESQPSSKSSKQSSSSSKTRLWKFMRDLLDNPEYNPEYIRWEDKEEGIFRIVAGRSKAIADLWGKIKNNPTMTFDKLGRSLRWCRANNGKFSAVPRDGKFPRKLCFRLVDPEEQPETTTKQPDNSL